MYFIKTKGVPTKEGSLKMLDVESFVSAQKVMWVKRLLSNKEEGCWKIYPQILPSKFLDGYIFQCNLHLKKEGKLMQKLYGQLFDSAEFSDVPLLCKEGR